MCLKNMGSGEDQAKFCFSESEVIFKDVTEIIKNWKQEPDILITLLEFGFMIIRCLYLNTFFSVSYTEIQFIQNDR